MVREFCLRVHYGTRTRQTPRFEHLLKTWRKRVSRISFKYLWLQTMASLGSFTHPIAQNVLGPWTHITHSATQPSPPKSIGSLNTSISLKAGLWSRAAVPRHAPSNTPHQSIKSFGCTSSSTPPRTPPRPSYKKVWIPGKMLCEGFRYFGLTVFVDCFELHRCKHKIDMRDLCNRHSSSGTIAPRAENRSFSFDSKASIYICIYTHI